MSSKVNLATIAADPKSIRLPVPQHVDLPPARSVRGLEFGISGGIAAMPRLGLGAAGKPSRLSRTRLTGVDPALSESPVNLVAGAGFEPAAFRL
jgi:hypothetical protein